MIELNGRFLNKLLTDSGSDCRRLLDLTAAAWREKDGLRGIKTYESAPSFKSALSKCPSTQ